MQTLKVFAVGMRSMRRDAVMLALIPAPFLMGALISLLMPVADGIARARWGLSLVPWYPLADAFLIGLTPLLPTMASAFLLLEEIDEGTGAYYRITPAGGRSYLAARIGMPALWGYVCSLAVAGLFGLSGCGLRDVLAASTLGALMSIAVSMMIVAVAGNRVEGLAISKLCGVSLAGIPVAWFAPAPWRWLAAFLPSFWVAELLYAGLSRWNILAGLAVNLVWIYAFSRRFLHRVG